MKSNFLRALAAVSLFALCIVTHAAESAKSVVFVCEHGSVKSVMAASYFNRMAEEQKLNMRAVARGTTPDAEVPAWAVGKLKEDGFDVSSFKPTALAKADTRPAVAIVAFCAVGKDLADPGKVSTWLDIPPASEDYAKAKAAILSKVEALVVDLKAK